MQLYQLWAEPLDLPLIKLLILHVSQHRDDAIVRPIWNRIFEEGKSSSFSLIDFLLTPSSSDRGC